MALKNEGEVPSELILRATYDVSTITPNRVTHVERFRYDKAAGLIKITYARRRATAFVRGCLDAEKRIGECELHVFPLVKGARGTAEDGKPSHFTVACDLVAALDVDVYLCWTKGLNQPWNEQKLEAFPDDNAARWSNGRASGEYATVLELAQDDDVGVLYHYFRLVGALSADRSKAVCRKREPVQYHGAFESEIVGHVWHFADGQPLGQIALCDNPYGPFSNYHF